MGSNVTFAICLCLIYMVCSSAIFHNEGGFISLCFADEEALSNEALVEDGGSSGDILESAAQEVKKSKNPFLTDDEVDYYDSIKGRKRVKKLEKEIPEGLELTAIFNLSSETLAVINGEVLKKGDYITDKKVVEVLSEQVTLEDDFKQYILEMKNPASQQYGTFDETLLKRQNRSRQ